MNDWSEWLAAALLVLLIIVMFVVTQPMGINLNLGATK